MEIPQTHPIELVWVDLSIEERLIYKRLENRFLDNLRRHLDPEVAKAKMKTWHDYSLRLRQATSHPFLLEPMMSTNFSLEDVQWLRAKLAQVGGRTPLWKQMDRFYSRHICNNTNAFGNADFGGAFDMDDQLQRLQNGLTLDDPDILCRVCYEMPVEPQMSEVSI